MKANRVALLEAKIAQLTARKQAAQKREMRAAARLTNRRKFLLGAFVLTRVGGDVRRLDAEFLAGLDRWATRKIDRDILNLPTSNPK